jgi:hypothetical protein
MPRPVEPIGRQDLWEGNGRPFTPIDGLDSTRSVSTSFSPPLYRNIAMPQYPWGLVSTFWEITLLSPSVLVHPAPTPMLRLSGASCWGRWLNIRGPRALLATLRHGECIGVVKIELKYHQAPKRRAYEPRNSIFPPLQTLWRSTVQTGPAV